MFHSKKVHCAIVTGVAMLGASQVSAASLLTNSPYLTTTMDAESATWYERGADVTNPTAGLPPAGIVHSLSDPNSTYLFQPYNGNNVLFLTGNTTAYRTDAATMGTLTFAQPQGVKTLAFAISDADEGNPTLNLTIHYSDGTPDLSTTLGPVPDWTTGAGTVIASGSGKAVAYQNTVLYSDNSATNINVPRVFQMILSLPNPTGPLVPVISSIDVTLPTVFPPGSSPQVAIFGVSGGNNSATSFFDPIPLTASSFNQDIVLEAPNPSAVPEPTIAGMLAIGAGLLSLRKRNVSC